ncbi:MAG: helix-turn-helix domain-containing protein [Spirochaetes bacterium]|nr:helix-turn-helix domain-containing protein [Spirochaetota bacterium]
MEEKDETDSLETSDPARIRLIALALGGEVRLRMLGLLSSGSRNMNEIASALGLPLSTATVNVRRLEEAGLVECRPAPGARGTQKIVSRKYGRLVLGLPSPGGEGARVIDMPIGHFVKAEVAAPCGICTAESRLGKKDDPRAFFFPERHAAELIWLSTGFVEYHFPNIADGAEPPSGLSLSAELCSEVPFYDNSATSDICLWINGVEIGTWRSPGDFGGRRGRLTPAWWGVHKTQFGRLVTWTVTESGSRIESDGVVGSSHAALRDLRLAEAPYIAVRLGVDPGAERPGGMNIFGRGFGDFAQGLVLRVR